MPWEVQHRSLNASPEGYCRIDVNGNVRLSRADLERFDLWGKEVVAVLADWKRRMLGIKATRDGKAVFALRPALAKRSKSAYVCVKAVLSRFDVLPPKASIVLPIAAESNMLVIHLPAPNTKKPPYERNSNA